LIRIRGSQTLAFVKANHISGEFNQELLTHTRSSGGVMARQHWKYDRDSPARPHQHHFANVMDASPWWVLAALFL